MIWGKRKKKSEGLLWRLIWVICLVFVFLLLIADISPMIAPDKMWIPAILGLAYPALVVVVLIFSLILAIKNIKKAIIPALSILIGLGLLNRSYSFRDHTNNFPQEESELKIMSYNVRLFDLYQWNDPGRIKDSIINYIESVNPDILCLQEYYKDDGPYFNTDTELTEKCGFKYKHIDYFLIKKDNRSFGIATFSKFPIIKFGSIKMNARKDNGNYVVWTDILFNDDTVRIYNTHLQSIKFSKEDDDIFVNHPKISQNDFTDRSSSLLRKIKRAFIARAKQVRFIKEEIDKCPHPYFICGDFNDTPTSYAYRTMRGSLNDAFLDAGPKGFGKTYNGTYPSFRIDYIFYPDQFGASHFTIDKKEFSDHFPIYCNFKRQKDD